MSALVGFCTDTAIDNPNIFKKQSILYNITDGTILEG